MLALLTSVEKLNIHQVIGESFLLTHGNSYGVQSFDILRKLYMDVLRKLGRFVWGNVYSHKHVACQSRFALK